MLVRKIVFWFVPILIIGTLFAQQGIYLPYEDPTVNLQQAWQYELSMGGGDHNAFDYINGPIDNSGPAPDHPNWRSFRVVASIDGTVIYYEGHNNGLGNYVNQQFTLNGENYRIWYCHLEDSPLTPNSPTPVTTGQFLGNAGRTGNANDVIHLHYVVLKYTKIGDEWKWVKVDPYGTASYEGEKLYRDNYYPNAPLGQNHIFATNPPTYVSIVDIGFFSDGWHSNGSSQAILNRFNASRTSGHNLGAPHDNGGGAYVHQWGSAWLQDFYGNNTGYYHGHTALILNSAQTEAHLLKEGFWDWYMRNNGGVNLGSAESAEYMVNGMTRQNFQHGTLIWNGSQVTVESSVTAAIISTHTITFTSEQSGVEVWSSGELLGSTPFNVELYNGYTYSLVAKKDGYDDKEYF